MRQTFTAEEQLVVEVPPEVASDQHPAIWHRSADNPNLLIALDWSGQKTGELEIMAEGRAGTSPSPEPGFRRSMGVMGQEVCKNAGF